MKRVYILSILGLGALLVGVFFFFSKDDVSVVPETPKVSETQDVIEKRIPPEGMLEYRSDAYKFSLFYPKNLKVVEMPEGDGAVTITFQDIKEARGFQVFILPYFEPQVSEARFKKDIPSGVRANLTNIKIDSAVGASFDSKDLFLGDTYEIWFIKNNYLYEVTTLKGLDIWIRDILNTWEFI